MKLSLLRRDYLKQNLRGTTAAAHSVAVRETTHTDTAAHSKGSKPEGGDATMALVTITKMVVPHAECTGRMPAGYSGTTKCVTLEHYRQKARKKHLWLLTKGLHLQAKKPLSYFSILPQLSV